MGVQRARHEHYDLPPFGQAGRVPAAQLNLIQGLMTVDPSRRTTMKDLRQDPWVLDGLTAFQLSLTAMCKKRQVRPEPCFHAHDCIDVLCPASSLHPAMQCTICRCNLS